MPFCLILSPRAERSGVERRADETKKHPPSTPFSLKQKGFFLKLLTLFYILIRYNLKLAVKQLATLQIPTAFKMQKNLYHIINKIPVQLQ